jgi:5-formyltetrahydrofolate cyclo-ligase
MRAMTKAEIRLQMRARRATMDDDARRAASRAITAALLARAEFRRAQEVACFLSLPQEIATDELLAACRAQDKRVCVPAWNATAGTYVLTRLPPSQEVSTGPHGVPEPAAGQAIDPQTVDLAIVPGLAFDAHGGRLGYGKGYYDRILASCRAMCCKIGVGYAWQVIAGDLPLASHDVRMDLLVTDAGVIGERLKAEGC